MSLVRLQCPACSTIVRVTPETAAAHPVVRCAKCHGLVNTTRRVTVPTQSTSPPPRRIAVHPGVLLGGSIALGLAVALVAYLILKPSAPTFADLQHRVMRPTARHVAPPPEAHPVDRPHRNPPALVRRDDSAPEVKPPADVSPMERRYRKVLEIYETTATLLHAARTPTDIKNARTRLDALWDELDELHKHPDPAATDETRELSGRLFHEYKPRIRNAHLRAGDAMTRLENDPALARAYSELFYGFDLPVSESDGRFEKRREPSPRARDIAAAQPPPAAVSPHPTVKPAARPHHRSRRLSMQEAQFFLVLDVIEALAEELGNARTPEQILTASFEIGWGVQAEGIARFRKAFNATGDNLILATRLKDWYRPDFDKAYDQLDAVLARIRANPRLAQAFSKRFNNTTIPTITGEMIPFKLDFRRPAWPAPREPVATGPPGSDTASHRQPEPTGIKLQLDIVYDIYKLFNEAEYEAWKTGSCKNSRAKADKLVVEFNEIQRQREASGRKDRIDALQFSLLDGFRHSTISTIRLIRGFKTSEKVVRAFDAAFRGFKVPILDGQPSFREGDADIVASSRVDKPRRSPSQQKDPDGSLFERQLKKAVEVIDTTADLLNAARTSKDIKDAAARVGTLLTEFDELEARSGGVFGERPDELEKQLLQQYHAPLHAAHRRALDAMQRLMLNPELAPTYYEYFGNVDLPSTLDGGRYNGRNPRVDATTPK